MKRLIIILLILCAYADVAQASSVSTNMGVAAKALKNGIEYYARKHDGNLPKNWEDIEDYLNHRSLELSLGTKISKRYELLFNQHVPLTYRRGVGVILALSNTPLADDRKENLGRYVIVLRDGKKFDYLWIDENLLEEAFSKVSVVLPKGKVLLQVQTGGYNGIVSELYKKLYLEEKGAQQKEEMSLPQDIHMPVANQQVEQVMAQPSPVAINDGSNNMMGMWIGLALLLIAGCGGAFYWLTIKKQQAT